MRLLILSDLHLESNPFSPLLPDGSRVDANADMVVLAGDIHEGIRGIRWARETFPDKGVLYVAGNHELWEGHWTRTLDDMREAANRFDVDFLEADGLDVGGVRFLGVSLWADFHLVNATDNMAALKNAKSNMNDYRYIKISRTAETHKIKGKFLVPELTAIRHAASVQWLEGKLTKGEPAKTVVITHHAPSGQSLPAHYKTDLTSAAYASNLERLMGRAGLWIHGHIHSSNDYLLHGKGGSTRIISNPRGNMKKNGAFENAHFNPALVVEV
jgi:Icc-related predicted phosphoesterase